MLLRKADFRPDWIVAVARGGYVPARLLCDHLDVRALSSLRIVHYLGPMDKAPEARLTEPVAVPLAGRRVLLVDDVTDTGSTLDLALAHLRAAQPADVRSAVLHHKVVSPIQPDFFAHRVQSWRWLVYPWARIEDVGCLLQRLEVQPTDLAQAAQALELRYGLRVPRGVLRAAWANLGSHQARAI
jgi:hypoxanthine phosphoribosyltransferase